MLKEVWSVLFGTKKRAIGSVGGAASIIAAVLAISLPHTMQWEGAANSAYWDRYGQVWTVCYGETDGVKRGDRYTDAECAEMLGARLVQFHGAVADCVGEKFTSAPVEVQAAVTSWAYNVGAGAACGSTLAKHLRAGNYRAACNELPRWRRAGGQVVHGLVNRRADEQALCLSGLQ